MPSVFPKPKEVKSLKANSDTCVFLGSGRSIRKITDEQWNILKQYDLWTVNNWVYHPFIVPHFYHVEAKWYDYDILQQRFRQKRNAYQSVKFIFPAKKGIRFKNGTVALLDEIVPFMADKYTYRMIGRDPKRTHRHFNAKYDMHPQLLTKSYDMSLTLIFELLYRLGYKRIVLFGVDLFNSYYFWTDWDECGKVHHQTNKEHEGKDPNMPHATARILEYIIDFNVRWMRPKAREIYVCHQETALYPYLKEKKPEDL